jgi:hypothetical protein
MQVTRINILWKDADINSVSFAFEDGITDVYSVDYSEQSEWDSFIEMFDYLFQVPTCNNIVLNLTPIKNIVAIYDLVTKVDGYIPPTTILYDDLPIGEQNIYNNFVNYIIGQMPTELI